jgi:hypothetical protein
MNNCDPQATQLNYRLPIQQMFLITKYGFAECKVLLKFVHHAYSYPNEKTLTPVVPADFRLECSSSSISPYGWRDYVAMRKVGAKYRTVYLHG